MSDPLRELLYDRNKGVQNVDAVKRVHVIGTGGIGTWTAIGFAMAGCKEVHVYDDDTLAASNLNRLPFTLDDVGQPKTKVIKNFLEKVRNDIKVVEHGRVTNAKDLKHVKKGDVVTICVDSAIENNKVIEALEGKKVKIIRGAYNGDSIVV